MIVVFSKSAFHLDFLCTFISAKHSEYEKSWKHFNQIPRIYVGTKGSSSIANSLSLSFAHRPDMTDLLLKRA